VLVHGAFVSLIVVMNIPVVKLLHMVLLQLHCLRPSVELHDQLIAHRIGGVTGDAQSQTLADSVAWRSMLPTCHYLSLSALCTALAADFSTILQSTVETSIAFSVVKFTRCVA